MGVDLTLPLRQSIVVHLRADPAVVAIVGQRVFGERVASEDLVWPFIRYGFDTADQFVAQGIDGVSVDVTLHTFSKADSTDNVKALNAVVIESLDDAQLVLDDGYAFDMTFVQVQTLPDGPDGFHGVVRFTALIGKDA